MSQELPGKLPPPYALSMGICDLIYRDPGTEKRFILGCFSVIHAREFPAGHPLMCIYLDLTGGRGPSTIKVQIVDSDEEREPLRVVEAQVDFSDPRAIMELDLPLPDVSFPEPGEYRIQLFASDEFIFERRLLVNRIGA